MGEIMEFEEPGTGLRFVRRDGRAILQQSILIKQFTTAHVHQIGQRKIWRDVPMVEDTAIPASERS